VTDSIEEKIEVLKSRSASLPRVSSTPDAGLTLTEADIQDRFAAG